MVALRKERERETREIASDTLIACTGGGRGYLPSEPKRSEKNALERLHREEGLERKRGRRTTRRPA